MVYSDSPYNIDLDYNKGLGGAKQYGGKTQDNKSDSEFKQFLTEIIQNALASVEKDSHFFYYCDQKYIGLLQQIYQEQSIDHKRVCLWIKNGHNPTPQVAFNKAYEPCVYGTRGKPFLSSKLHNLNEVFNKEVGSGNRLTDDILDLFDIWLAKRKAMNEYTHPTEKPPTLHEKAIRRCTQPGDIILDQFGGSGSTLIACEQLKRRAILVEIEPVFCDLIIKRYEQFTGKKARKLN
ncbi:site-specific DNA-methyltransferase [Candidatus Roizmanbacteria bacterium]|nr:MAG: site-specific DNA-methyltransferase [Candidatus Roizmanbacteria bacterium]